MLTLKLVLSYYKITSKLRLRQQLENLVWLWFTWSPCLDMQNQRGYFETQQRWSKIWPTLMVDRRDGAIQGKPDNGTKCWEKEVEAKAKVSGGHLINCHDHQPWSWSSTMVMIINHGHDHDDVSGGQAGDWCKSRRRGWWWVGGASKENLVHRAARLPPQEYSMIFIRAASFHIKKYNSCVFRCDSIS